MDSFCLVLNQVGYFFFFFFFFFFFADKLWRAFPLVISGVSMFIKLLNWKIV